MHVAYNGEQKESEILVWVMDCAGSIGAFLPKLVYQLIRMLEY